MRISFIHIQSIADKLLFLKAMSQLALDLMRASTLTSFH